MLETDQQKALKARVAKIKNRKGPVRDTAAGLVQDEPGAPAKPKSGTPTLLQLFAIALAVSSMIISEAPEKFGMGGLFADATTQPETQIQEPIQTALASSQ